jgi:N-acylneuraminate cytidylyltransferase/3-deoxy-D-manno-octulosonate 8-phosphate phosphatase (KDO 8-P phosphatase)
MDINNLDALIFDFDGVLTNNKVHVNEDGKEWVTCSRADGLAFDVLRKIKKHTYILSTESNVVVAARAKKLKVPVIQGVDNKYNAIKKLAAREGFKLQNILYVGNDLNDYNAMQLCGFTACPSDSHEMIKSISTVVLDSKGGSGVVRELLEVFLDLNFIEILYLNKG